MTVAPEGIAHDEYTITWAEPRHADAFVSLHREVFGTWEPRGRAQFDWKYADNPFVADLPVIVVEDRAGDVVGARGYFAFPVSVGDENRLALQSSDLMVHPDHRRQGLFREMNRLGGQTYADADVLFFSFPGAAPRRGYLADDWTEVANPVYVRQLDWEPDALATPTDYVALAGSLGMRAGLAVLDRLASVGQDDEVSVHEDPDPAVLVDLYERRVPDGVHARRTEAFYEWRMSEPAQHYRAYLLEREGQVAAAALVSDWGDNRQIREILPYDAGRSAVAALLRVVARRDDAGADFLRAWRPASLDRTALLAAGLLPETALPFISANDDLVTLGNEATTSDGGDVGGGSGLDLTEPAAWDLQLLERDY